MKQKCIHQSIVLMLVVSSLSLGMERPPTPDPTKKSKSHIVRKKKKAESRPVRKSLSAIDPKLDALKEEAATTKPRSFSFSLSSYRPKEAGVTPKTPKSSLNEDQHPSGGFLGIFRRRSSASAIDESIVQTPKTQQQDDQAKNGSPSFSAAHVILARQAKFRRNKYAEGRSGRDSLVDITARDYLGSSGKNALVADPSPNPSPRSEDVITPRSDDVITPRSEEVSTPRSDEDSSPRSDSLGHSNENK